jgi:hypothetical protein
MPKHQQSKTPSPTNVNAFSTEGYQMRTMDIPSVCTVSGRVGDILSFKVYYFEAVVVLGTCTFSTTAAGSTINDGKSSPGSTKVNNETGRNCKMPCKLFTIPSVSKFLVFPWTPGLPVKS